MRRIGEGLARGASSRSWSRTRRGQRPGIECCEGRALLNAAVVHHATAPAEVAKHHAPTPHTSTHNPLAPYRIFVGTIDRGPDAGTTFTGPIVLGYDGRIQVIGYFYPERGPRATVVGTVYGGASELRFLLSQGGALEVSGTGQLQRVQGGLPDGMNLVGQGNLSGPSGNDFGHWVTLAPSRFATR